ncbi:MAG TPA: hypothetical protein VNG33_22915, partial [Polyangiaceae bacterium]|nr:hypothetical protein [Polyangiaceae bacterium]
LRRALKIPTEAKFSCVRAKTPFIEEYAEEFPSLDAAALESEETAGLSGDWLLMTNFVPANEARGLEQAAKKMKQSLEQISFVRFPSESGYTRYPVFRVGLTPSGSLVGVVTMRLEN